MDPNIVACTGNLIVTVCLRDNKVAYEDGSVLSFGGTNLVVTPEAIQFTLDDKYGFTRVLHEEDVNRDQKIFVRKRMADSGYESEGFFDNCERFSLTIKMKRLQYFKYEDDLLSFWIAKFENKVDCLSLNSRRIDCAIQLDQAMKASEWFVHLALPYLKVMHHDDVVNFEFEGRDKDEVLAYQKSVNNKYKDNLDFFPIYVINEARGDVLDGGADEIEKIQMFLGQVARHIPWFRNRMEELKKTKLKNEEEKISIVLMFNSNVNNALVPSSSKKREGGSDVMDLTASTSNADQEDSLLASHDDFKGKSSDATEE